MDGYKKSIFTGSLMLIAGYFLPWHSGLAGTATGLDALLVGLDAVRTMHTLGQYEYESLAGFAALALPAAGALLSMLYCLARPAGGNGSFGSLLFLLPLLSLAISGAYLTAAHHGLAPGGAITSPFAGSVLDSAMDLGSTGGLWLVALGALLMGLGRVSR